jgi:hypothetical protein
MSDLTAALREAGHVELADQLERKELAGRLRESGRADLADQLAGDKAPADEPPAQPHEQLAKRLREAQSEWHSLGGSDGRDA